MYKFSLLFFLQLLLFSVALCLYPVIVLFWLVCDSPKCRSLQLLSHYVDSVVFCVLDLLFVILKSFGGEESRVKILSEYWKRCFSSIRNIIVLSSSYTPAGKS